MGSNLHAVSFCSPAWAASSHKAASLSGDHCISHQVAFHLHVSNIMRFDFLMGGERGGKPGETLNSDCVVSF